MCREAQVTESNSERGYVRCCRQREEGEVCACTAVRTEPSVAAGTSPA